MKVEFDATEIEGLAEELTKGIADFNKEAKPFLKALGEKAADDMVNAILTGKDLEGSSLKPNEASTAHRKKAKRNQDPSTPLIDSGALSKRENWKVGIRKSKKGLIHAVANPGKDRKEIFYNYLKAKGYDKSQGMTAKFARHVLEEEAKFILKLMGRWMKGDTT